MIELTKYQLERMSIERESLRVAVERARKLRAETEELLLAARQTGPFPGLDPASTSIAAVDDARR